MGVYRNMDCLTRQGTEQTGSAKEDNLGTLQWMQENLNPNNLPSQKPSYQHLVCAEYHNMLPGGGLRNSKVGADASLVNYCTSIHYCGEHLRLSTGMRDSMN